MIVSLTDLERDVVIIPPLSLRPPEAKSRTLLQHNFGGMDLERLLELANKFEWPVIEDASTVDEQLIF